MGCGASHEAQHIDPIDVADTESGYPPPKPPRDKKENVFKEDDCATIDANAKRDPQNLASSYEALINYVTQGTSNDVQKVRAIYCWLAAQSIYTMKFPKLKDAHSPQGYMKTIQQGDGSYTAFFALLCRAAKIPCVIVHGSGKAASYEVGDQDISKMISSWTAVHVDGSWRLVHIFWALVGLQGFNKGGWTKVEEGGKAVRQKEKASAGKTVNKQDDFWFLTDPDQFIYFCRSVRSEWQLLKTSWPQEKFLNVPYFSINYFDSGFTLQSQHAAVLQSDKGKCDITFKHPENIDADLDYTLLFDEQNSKDKLPQSLQLDRYVIQFGTRAEKSLRVRFPVRGIYKIKVTGSAKYRCLLARFRLVCEEVLDNVQPYPANPSIGFGYNKIAKDFGLEKPSHVKGIVVTQPGETVVFQFRCTAKLDLQTQLVHKDVTAANLASYVTQDRSGDDVTVKVTVPSSNADNPEYALQVNARSQEGSGNRYDNVLNYLLTHGKDHVDENKTNRSQKEKPAMKEDEKLRQELLAATESQDIGRLEKAIKEYQRVLMPNQTDLAKARQTLISLHEQELRAAINARKLDALEAAIEAAHNSTVYPELYERQTLPEAEALQSQMRRMKSYLHRILELKPMTVSEIHSYKRPRPLVHTVMKATYLLLGEREQQLQEWQYIQALLRRQGRDSIIRRIKEFDLVHMKTYRMNRAETQLKTCNKSTVRQASAGAGTFFVWSSNIIREGKSTQKENT